MSDPCTPYERAGLVVWLFCQGASLTALEVSHKTGLHIRQAQYLLITLARVIPLYREPSDGKWQLLTDETQ